MPGINAEAFSVEDDYDQSYDNYSFGFHVIAEYNHAKKNTDIVDIAYNSKLRRFVILDTRGVSLWSNTSSNLERHITFPKYQNRLLRLIIFCEKHHVYFAICNDFTLQVYNKDFVSTCKTSNSNMRSVLHIAYNSKTDELISAGMAGTTVWKYRQSSQTKFEQIQSKANYSLIQTSHHRDVGGSWCTKVVLLPQIQQVFFCSENDLYVHACKGLALLFCMKNAHLASLTCVDYSSATKMLVTGSMDTDVKVWTSNGGYIDTFRGHSQPVTALKVNPVYSGLVTTSSLDGTVKVWSLHVMELFYSLNVFPRGIDWMSLTNDNMLWCATEKKLVMYQFDSVASFWGHARGKVANMQMSAVSGKTSRVLAAGEDGSVRMFNATSNNKIAVCTVLPPPVSSAATQAVFRMTYSRNNNLIFILIGPYKIWIYTCKTDPACRIAEWNLAKIFESACLADRDSPSTMYLRPKVLLAKPTMCKPVLNVMGFDLSYKCCSMTAVHSPHGFQFEGPNGLYSVVARDLLLLGLQDGRVLFMDQVLKGRKHFEMLVAKDPIRSIKFDQSTCRLYTCSGIAESNIQVWTLPELHHVIEIKEIPDLTSFSLFETYFASGHTNGSVEITKIPSTKSSSGLSSTEQLKTVNFRDTDRENTANQLRHKCRVIDIQDCSKRSVFASCSDDGAIKIWGYDKALLTEIWLDDSLTCCLFLNSHADLLVGWKNHIYLINRLTVLSQFAASSDESEESDNGSKIYEDPSIRFEQVQIKKEESITMENYLVPFEFVRKSLTKDQDHIPEVQCSRENSSTSISCEFVHAPTELYRSPPESISSSIEFDTSGNLLHRDNWVFPEFGDSPNPTPSVSSIESEKEVIKKKKKDAMLEIKKEISLKKAEQKEDELSQSLHSLSSLASLPKFDLDLLPEVEIKDSVAEIEEKTGEIVQCESDKDVEAGEQISCSIESVVEAVATAFEEQLNSEISKAVKSKEEILPRPKQFTQQPQQNVIKPKLKKARAPPSGTKFRFHLRSEVCSPEFAKQDVFDVSNDTHSQTEGVEYTRIVPKILTYGEEQIRQGKEISVNQTFSNRYQKNQFYKHSKFERPDKNDTLHAVSAFKSLAIGGKQRVNLARKRSFISTLRGGKMITPRSVPASIMKSSELDVIAQAQSKPAMEDRNSVMEVILTRKPALTLPVQKAAEREKPTSKEREVKEVRIMAKEEIEQEKSNTLASKHIRPGFSEPKLMMPGSNISISNRENRPKTHIGIRLSASAYDWTDPDFTDLNDYAKIDDIYKNDGLQLDNNWQDRMLERYMFLKKQREYRQKTCAERREMLMKDKRYKILSHLPEVTYSETFAWYDDHNRLASRLLNSPLLSGEREFIQSDMHPKKPPATPITVSSLPEGRPCSVSDTLHDAEPENEGPPAGYRLSLRKPGSAAVFNVRKISGRKTSFKSRCYSAPFRSSSPHGGSTTQRSERSGILMVDRPRSSASIPGKTRYMLVKDESSKKPRVRAPNRLEEQLLRQRFPAQHRAVIRAMKKMQVSREDDTDQLECRYSGDFAEPPIEEHATESNALDPHPASPSNYSASLHSKPANDSSPRASTKASGKRNIPSPSACTLINYPPISVLHRKTCNYTPTSFRA